MKDERRGARDEKKVIGIDINSVKGTLDEYHS